MFSPFERGEPIRYRTSPLFLNSNTTSIPLSQTLSVKLKLFYLSVLFLSKEVLLLKMDSQDLSRYEALLVVSIFVV